MVILLVSPNISYSPPKNRNPKNETGVDSKYSR